MYHIMKYVGHWPFVPEKSLAPNEREKSWILRCHKKFFDPIILIEAQPAHPDWKIANLDWRCVFAICFTDIAALFKRAHVNGNFSFKNPSMYIFFSWICISISMYVCNTHTYIYIFQKKCRSRFLKTIQKHNCKIYCRWFIINSMQVYIYMSIEFKGNSIARAWIDSSRLAILQWLS